MKLERRSSFGWPATAAGSAPCKNGLVAHYDGSDQGLAEKNHSACRTYWTATRRFHMGPARGWVDIAYSYGVCPHGHVLEGRGFGRQQAAQPGGNSTWTSCTFMSGPNEAPTTAQINAWRELRAYLRGQGMGSAVRGHRDFISTSCLPLDTTELLTRRGWVNLGEVSPDDQVASWSMDSGTVTFDRPAGIVEPYEDQTVLIDDVETTADHTWVTYGQRAWAVGCSCGYEGSPASIRSHVREGRRRGEPHDSVTEERWKLVRADQMSRGFRYPGAVESGGPGLDLSADQVRLMVWLQGDGHFMREHRGRSPDPYGVEWHLKKPRKVERLAGLLHAMGIAYRRNEKADGSVCLRAYGDVAREQIVALLPAKRFHWGLLDLSAHQAAVFLEELLHVDGCQVGSYFSSMEEINLDVAQAVAMLNGRIASRAVDPHKVMFRRGLVKRPWARSVHRHAPGRKTLVGCLTTVNGTLLIRQHGRTAVVGNCPGGALYDMVKSGALTGAPKEDDDMPTVKDIWHTDNLIEAPPDQITKGNKFWTAGSYLVWGYRQDADTNQRVKALEAKLAEQGAQLAEVLALLKAK